MIHPLLYRAAAAACFIAGLLPPTTLAQPTASGFTFCTVTDMSGGGMGTAKVWASPVIEFTHRTDDHIGLQRSQELASEFHRFVGTLGGAGEKNCAIGSTAAELETLREEQRTMWTKRVLLWASKWQDVAWTPAPWDPATAPPKPAVMTKYFYCYSIDPDVRRSVASEVFNMPVPGDDALAPYRQAEAYAREFGQVAVAQGVPDGGPLCVFHDTQAEAEKSRQEMRRPFSDFTQRFIDLRWTPTATATAALQQPAAPAQPTPAEPQSAVSPGQLGLKLDAVTPGLATGLGLAQPQGALVVAVVAGSGAERAGVRPLDVILEIAGQPVQTPADVQAVAGRMRPDYRAPLRIWRERAALELEVPLTAAAPATAAPAPAAEAAPLHCYARVSLQRRILWISPLWQQSASGDIDGTVATARDQFLQQARALEPALAGVSTQAGCNANNGPRTGYGCSAQAGTTWWAEASCIADGELMARARDGTRNGFADVRDIDWQPAAPNATR